MISPIEYIQGQAWGIMLKCKLALYHTVDSIITRENVREFCISVGIRETFIRENQPFLKIAM